MNSLLFKNAKLVDPEAGTLNTGGLIVRDGKITEILTQRTDYTEEKLTAVNFSQVIDCNGKHLAPGIVDLGVKVCEPGERHKESFGSAGLAAAAGGVTTEMPLDL